MDQELVPVPCPACGAVGEADPQASRWRCASCQKGFFLRRCSACARVSYVNALHGFGQAWACTWCGHPNTGFNQNRDPAEANAGDLAAEIASSGPPGGPLEPGGTREPAESAPGPAGAAPVITGEVLASEPGAGTGDPGKRKPTLIMDADVAGGTGGTGGPGGAPPEPAAATRSRRGRIQLIGLLAAVAAASAIAVTIAVLPTGSNPATRVAPGPAGQTGPTGQAPPGQAPTGQAAPSGQAGTSPPVNVVTDRSGTVNVTASGVAAIDFQGIPGQLAVVGTGPGQVALTGQLHGAGGTPSVEAVKRADGTLVLSVRCPSAGSCTEALRLSVPGATPATVQQSGASVTVTGLAGPLQITGTRSNVHASGLSSPSLATAITNGHLDAAFTAAPSKVSVTLVSAQATLHLPASASYQVAKDVTSGSVRDLIPQSGTAPNTVTASLLSSELDLLPR